MGTKLFVNKSRSSLEHLALVEHTSGYVTATDRAHVVTRTSQNNRWLIYFKPTISIKTSTERVQYKLKGSEMKNSFCEPIFYDNVRN